MANIGVSGKVQDSEGNPVSDAWVYVFDAEISQDPVPIAGGFTDLLGNYGIFYSKYDYGIEHRPDLIIRVYDKVYRQVFESVEYPDVAVTVFSAPLIVIPVADLKGWLVTLLTGTPTLISSGNVVTELIDNKVAWEKLTNEVKGAASFVNTCQLYLDAGKVFTIFTPSPPVIGSPTAGDRLEEEIYKANSRTVQTRVIMNDFIAEPYPIDTAGVVDTYFDKKKPHTVVVRHFSMPYNRAMHAKFTVIDAKVVIMNASPFLQEYFDDVSHSIDDARRGTMNFPKNSIKVPVHDVSLAIEGPAVEDMEKTFDVLWRETGGTAVIVTPFIPPDPGKPKCSLQIVRTLPGATFLAAPGAIPKGELGILEGYMRAFANSQSLIYLENQYITLPHIMQSLLLALIANPQVQAIILTNNAVDVPRYQGIQTKLILQFLADAKKNSVDDRVGIFTRWTHDSTSTPQRIIRNYIHSKVGIVDDKWATIGSANLDGVSLLVSQHLCLYVSVSDKLEERAVEANAVVYNDVDGQSASTFPDDLRRALWAEHLGITSPLHPSLITAPTGGWLKLWKDAAAAKHSGLLAKPVTSYPAAILEWKGEKKAENYLAALGIKPSGDLTIETEVKDFDFTKGKWV